MMVRLDATVAGAHVHVRVWTGLDREHLALAGLLCFRAGEWLIVRKALCAVPGASRVFRDNGESIEVLGQETECLADGGGPNV